MYKLNNYYLHPKPRKVSGFSLILAKNGDIIKLKEEKGGNMVHIGNDWDTLLGDEFKMEYYLSLREFLNTEYFTKKVYPPMGDIFNALKYTSYENARVVILGQDPDHGEGQAHGLCFSVKRGTPHPPSLKNIFKELI